MKVIDYKIVTSSTSSRLGVKVLELMKEGWTPKGGHIVAETFRQNKYSGMQHMATQIDREYSQTLIKYES